MSVTVIAVEESGMRRWPHFRIRVKGDAIDTDDLFTKVNPVAVTRSLFVLWGWAIFVVYQDYDYVIRIGRGRGDGA